MEWRAPAASLVLTVALGTPSEAAPPERWALPAAGDCGARVSGPRVAEDAGSFPFRAGQTIELPRLGEVKRFLPAAVWDERDAFFYEGMRLEVGPCFKDYSPPPFFQQATARSGAQLSADGGLDRYAAGLPFPPSSIDPAGPDAAAKWAWNAASRYRGSGFRGKFRVTDLKDAGSQSEAFEGEIFQIQLAHRADLLEEGFRVPFADPDELWVAGGQFTEPFNLRELAWRQYRPADSVRDPDRDDDLHAYLPQLRRVRRLPSADVEGLFLPSFSAGATPAQALAVPGGGAGVSAGGAGEGGGAAVSAGGGTAGGGATGGPLPAEIGHATEGSRNGFEHLDLRPNLWSWKLVGLQDVLAPINVAGPMYPEAKDRSFGPSGVSLADRWDLRRAVVLEATPRAARPAPSRRVLYYFDQQTLVPLYAITYGPNGEVAGVEIHAGRWSEDRPDYPRWPGDAARPVRVIDSVATVYAAPDGRGSWRRESWEMVSTPPSDEQLRRMISLASLERGD
jgi:hypothetical protein